MLLLIEDSFANIETALICYIVKYKQVCEYISFWGSEYTVSGLVKCEDFRLGSGCRRSQTLPLFSRVTWTSSGSTWLFENKDDEWIRNVGRHSFSDAPSHSRRRNNAIGTVIRKDRPCFQKGASYSGIRIFNSLPQSITNPKNEKTQFKVAIKKFLNARSFYSVDELFTCTDDMYRWLYDCVNVSYTVIFLLFVCLWNVPHPIVLWLSRIYGMYVCMYVCMQIQSYCK